MRPTSSGGCYVATCVYGSYDCPQVWTLRRYRDDMLACIGLENQTRADSGMPLRIIGYDGAEYRAQLNA